MRKLNQVVLAPGFKMGHLHTPVEASAWGLTDGTATTFLTLVGTMVSWVEKQCPFAQQRLR